ncbi:hypothetical protein N0V95_002764 [Ascochyta clinopodiicola]|nr:hypothetical protein N0V95_002764 [Ascochyta clinopodiicola]
MPAYAVDDLISLADSGDESSVVVSPTSASMTANRRNPAQRDSFSDLTGLMKAKKPYTPVPPSLPRMPLSVTTNGMQFASRVASGSSMMSPLARPYYTDGSVAAYLQDQARSPTSDVTEPASEYRQDNMRRLESIIQELNDLPLDNDENMTVHQLDHTTSVATDEPLLPSFDLLLPLPVRAGPISPPTPAESTRPTVLEESVVRVTKHVWDSMGRDLEELKNEKRMLETEIVRLEKQKANPHMEGSNDEMPTQIGQLRYQNEHNKTQKATMARALSEKDIQINDLQLEISSLKESLETTVNAVKDHADIVAQLGYLQAKSRDDGISASRLLADLTDIKNREIENLSKKVDDLRGKLEVSKMERSAVTDSNELKTTAQDRLDLLNQRDKLLRSSQERYAAEHTKVGKLEDDIETLQQKLNQVGDLQAMFREKGSECDRYRTQLKNQEKRVEDYKQRILRASKDGAALRGAAHLVKPQANTKLSALVLGCSECYAQNVSCDNKARCRSCTENNEICARWRCGLHHILGQCPDTPCRFPHDEQGWLCQVEPRPEW